MALQGSPAVPSGASRGKSWPVYSWDPRLVGDMVFPVRLQRCSCVQDLSASVCVCVLGSSRAKFCGSFSMPPCCGGDSPKYRLWSVPWQGWLWPYFADLGLYRCPGIHIWGKGDGVTGDLGSCPDHQHFHPTSALGTEPRMLRQEV